MTNNTSASLPEPVPQVIADVWFQVPDQFRGESSPHRPGALANAVYLLAEAYRDVVDAAEAFLEAQGSLDNRELQGVNGEDYSKLRRRMNAAREGLESALATPAPAAAPSMTVAGSYLSWAGFNLRGDAASINEARRLVEFEAARQIPKTTPTPAEPVAWAEMFHATYERLAPQFGYKTRPETRRFNPTSPNGRLMTAVCAEMFAAAPARDVGAVPEGWQLVPVEPTIEMLAAAVRECGLSGSRLYRVMLAAAPQAEPKGQR